MGKVRLVQRFVRSWRFLGSIVIPIVLLPIIFIPDEDQGQDHSIEGLAGEEDGDAKKSTKFRMAYAMLVMSFYWALELAPLPITALLPLLLFPILGIQDIYAVSENYSKESNMIFLTGVIVAIGLEYCNLHRRIALRVMTLVGGSAVRLLWATMTVTAILAMWLSSTTCAVLVLPTVVALIDEVNDSPVTMTKSQARRKSRISANGLGLESDRKLSSFSTSTNNPYGGGRRRSTVFENAALARPRRGSTPAISWNNNLRASSPGFRKTSMYPNLKIMDGAPNRSRSPTPSTFVTPSSSPVPLKSKRVSMLINQSRKDNDDNPGSPTSSRASTPEINGNLNGKHNSFREPRPERSGTPPLPIIYIHNDMDSNYDEQQDADDKTEQEIQEEQKMKDNIKTMFLLGIAYAANIGGTAVITGAGPNKVFKEIIKPHNFDQDGKYKEMTFFLWLLFQLPPMIVNVFIAWLYLAITYQGVHSLRRWLNEGKDSEDATIYKWRVREVSTYLRREYTELGRMSYHEVAVGSIFIMVIIAWIFRDPEMFKGWGDLYTGAKSGDSTGAMFGLILLFIIPKNWDFLFGDSEDAIYEPLLDWKFTASKLPWSVLLLLGSGFALADGFEKSGLSDWIGTELKLFGNVSQPVLLLIVVVGTSVITEVVSNVACASIILPIVITISKTLKIHPLYLTVSAAVACSYAFMLPVASPTNALVFASGNFSSLQMARTGVFLNIICISVLYLNTVTLGDYLFDFYNYDYLPTNGTRFSSN